MCSTLSAKFTAVLVKVNNDFIFFSKTVVLPLGTCIIWEVLKIPLMKKCTSQLPDNRELTVIHFDDC